MAKPKYKSDRKTTSRPSKNRQADTRRSAQHKNSDPKPPSKQQKPQKTSVDSPDLPIRTRREGKRLAEKTGLVLESPPNKDYALLDSGNGEKLERYGALKIRRPEGQAIWLPSLPQQQWDAADATFTGDTDEEGQGRWRFSNGERSDASAPETFPPETFPPETFPPETFPMEFDGLAYLGRFTSFRHTGVFPEQAAHWQSMQRAVENARLGRPVRMLNLFGYTGLASLVAARAGAEVTHVDASKKAIGWARENQQHAGLDPDSIRWICDDAMKFCAREVRRNRTYDIILLDPPAYGRGPKGEVWQLFDHLPHMLDLVRELQSDRPLMTILTAYAIRASHFAIHEIMQEVFAGLAGQIESGELILRQEAGGRALSTSMFSRYLSKECQI